MEKITITVRVIIADITIIMERVKKQVAAAMDIMMKKAVTAEMIAKAIAVAAAEDVAAAVVK